MAIGLRLIQRFGSALNLNIHFHMLVLDGAYVERSHGSQRFCWVTAPSSAALTRLTQTLALRIGRYVDRQDWHTRDAHYCMARIVPTILAMQSYRIALGPQQGRKVFTLQTVPARTVTSVMTCMESLMSRAQGCAGATQLKTP